MVIACFLLTSHFEAADETWQETARAINVSTSRYRLFILNNFCLEIYRYSNTIDPIPNFGRSETPWV